MGRARLRVVTALALVLATACGATLPFGAGQPGIGVVRSDVLRTGADPAAARAAATAIDAVGVDLYRWLARTPGNVVFSPYSVVAALAMTRAGALGMTADQMDTVLHASLVGDLDAGMNALDQALGKRPGRYPFGDTTVDLELGTADQLFGQRGTAFEKAFLDRLAASYGAGMRLVDYVGATEQARGEINSWVAGRTKDRIPELIPSGAIDAMTRLVLANALYLKAKWTAPFPKNATADAPFHPLAAGDVTVPFMRLSSQALLFASAPGYKAVRLRYVGGLSMFVIVPDAGTFTAFEASLRDGARLRTILDSLAGGAQVTLRMPRFTFRTKAMLKPALSVLGMPIAFTDRADLGAISTSEKLQISDVAHEAFIAVDEEGTEAAAATAVLVSTTSAPQRAFELTVDRPFLFLIRDDETGATLFMGRVVDPRG